MTSDNALNLGWISCARKAAYMTRKWARDAASRLGKRDQKRYRVYACSHCGAFHLTSKEK